MMFLHADAGPSDADRTYARLLAKLHGLHSSDVIKQSGGHEMVTANSETLAMFEAYLPSASTSQKQSVMNIQNALHVRQDYLIQLYDQGELSAEQYVSLSNKTLRDAMQDCAEVLGPEGFEALFGTRVEEVGDSVDLATFLESEKRRH